jgi:hypothetical protein
MIWCLCVYVFVCVSVFRLTYMCEEIMMLKTIRKKYFSISFVLYKRIIKHIMIIRYSEVYLYYVTKIRIRVNINTTWIRFFTHWIEQVWSEKCVIWKISLILSFRTTSNFLVPSSFRMRRRLGQIFSYQYTFVVSFGTAGFIYTHEDAVIMCVKADTKRTFHVIEQNTLSCSSFMYILPNFVQNRKFKVLL